MVCTLMVLILVVGVTRFLPLLFAKRLRESVLVARLSTLLSPVILLLMIAHTLRDIPLVTFPYGVPAFAGLLATVAAHVIWRKLALSVLMGDGAYVLVLNMMQV